MNNLDKFTGSVLVAFSLSLAALGTGCTQMPTEKQGVADVRPQLSFQLADPVMGAAQVVVDGLAMGEAGRYVAGVASLRVLPGTHDLQVTMGGRSVLSERFYVGDGVNKTFVLK